MIDSLLNDIFENAQPIAITLTFFVAVMTQYLSVNKEVVGENGQKYKKFTLWGIVLLPIMSIGAAISIFLYLEETKQTEKETESKIAMQDQITAKFSQVIKDTGAIISGVNVVQKQCSEIDGSIEVLTKLTQEQFALVRNELGKIDNSCPSSNKDSSDIETIRNEIDELKTEKQNAVIERLQEKNKLESTTFDYTLSLDSLDVSQCLNDNEVKYYWDIKVGTERFTLLPPGSSESEERGFVSFDNETLNVNDVRSSNAPMVISGYVREMTGRSMFRRYYQYRYPGAFSEVIQYKANLDGTQKIEITFDANKTNEGSKCVFTILGSLSRTKRSL